MFEIWSITVIWMFQKGLDDMVLLPEQEAMGLKKTNK